MKKPWGALTAVKIEPDLFNTYLQPVQSIQIGGRLSRTQYQYTLRQPHALLEVTQHHLFRHQGPRGEGVRFHLVDIDGLGGDRPVHMDLREVVKEGLAELARNPGPRGHHSIFRSVRNRERNAFQIDTGGFWNEYEVTAICEVDLAGGGDGRRPSSSDAMDWLEIALRLGAATGAGMVIGIERELRHRPAGLRTHMLVSLGAATVMSIATEIDANASRVVQGVVTGIGFIGGGAILHSEGRTEGVTTAASIWVCTMIGVAAGGGYFKIMIATLVLALFVLAGCLLVERSLHTKGGERQDPTRGK